MQALKGERAYAYKIICLRIFSLCLYSRFSPSRSTFLCFQSCFSIHWGLYCSLPTHSHSVSQSPCSITWGLPQAVQMINYFVILLPAVKKDQYLLFVSHCNSKQFVSTTYTNQWFSNQLVEYCQHTTYLVIIKVRLQIGICFQLQVLNLFSLICFQGDGVTIAQLRHTYFKIFYLVYRLCYYWQTSHDCPASEPRLQTDRSTKTFH